MLTIAECKQYLPADTPDDKVAEIREALYGLAELALESLETNKNNNEKQYTEN